MSWLTYYIAVRMVLSYHAHRQLVFTCICSPNISKFECLFYYKQFSKIDNFYIFFMFLRINQNPKSEPVRLEQIFFSCTLATYFQNFLLCFCRFLEDTLAAYHQPCVYATDNSHVYSIVLCFRNDGIST